MIFACGGPVAGAIGVSGGSGTQDDTVAKAGAAAFETRDTLSNTDGRAGRWREGIFSRLIYALFADPSDLNGKTSSKYADLAAAAC
jgi:hypothetical protein